MSHRILMGMVVMPFIVVGWLYSVWLSEQAVQAAEHRGDHTEIFEAIE